jgi:hypothetical protein
MWLKAVISADRSFCAAEIEAMRCSRFVCHPSDIAQLREQDRRFGLLAGGTKSSPHHSHQRSVMPDAASEVHFHLWPLFL